MEIGDVAQIKLGGKWGDVDINLNVYHAFNMTADLDLMTLLLTLAGGLVPEVQALYTTAVKIDTLDAINLFDKSEAAELYLGLQGSRVGIMYYLPSQAAVTTRYVHDNPTIRYGYKRHWQIPEIDQDNGILTASAILKYEPVSWAPILDMVPDAAYVIVKRIRTNETPPYEYRLPESVAELDFGTVGDFDLNTRVASQNSRKCPPI